ncbi:MAG: hypothetical protein WDA65_08695 [Christensenellales bacterium]
MSLTHWKKLHNPDYLGAYSIENGKDLILTISNVKQEEVIGTDGKKEECIVCYFSDADKPMILNATNAKQIQKLTGTPYIEKWVGFKVQIGIEKVKAFGEVVEALRIRKHPPKAIDIKCESCGQAVTAANNMSAEQLAEYTAKKYKKKLCADCAMQIAQKGNATEQDTEAVNEADKT